MSRPLQRRTFLASLAAGAAAATALRAWDEEAPLPESGRLIPDLAPFDELLRRFVAEHQVPGAALAVARSGRLVYARGFGFADAGTERPVEPEMLFRIASVSKPLTAAAVLQLVEQGKLRLDDPVWSKLGMDPPTYDGARVDPGWERITVRHCLQHTGGWDRAVSYDPIGRPWEIARALGGEPPVASQDVVRYMLGQPLDFAPGERYAYSNLGYLVLGRLIETASGESYEDFVRRRVLKPLGLTAPRLGRALPENRPEEESAYRDREGRTAPCLYPPRRGQDVPLPDGAENFEGYAAHGGWIASAADLARFGAACDDPRRAPVKEPELRAAERERPAGAAGAEPDGAPKAAYYGLGWMVRPVGDGGANLWHAGYIAGSEALLVRRWDGLVWAVLFNTQDSPAGGSLVRQIDGPLHEAADAVECWPTGEE